MEVRRPLRPSKTRIAVEVALSKTNVPVPVVNGKSLHSRYDPVAEARKLVAEKLTVKPSARAALVLGLGFGYHIQALRDALPPGAPIAVFEPLSEIVQTYATVIGKNIDQVRLWPTPTAQDVVDAVADAVSPAMVNQVLIVGHPPSVEQAPADYQMILATIQSTMDQIAMTLTTGWGFGFQWIEHALQNVRRLPDLPVLEQVTARLRPAAPSALIIGAGPSLDQDWDVIRASEVLKLAVDTALEPMEHAGVAPHLAFLFDSQIENARLIERVDTARINLVTTLEVHPSVFERSWNNLLLASCDLGLMTWLQQRLGFDAGSVKQGGSVATGAFDYARRLGCRGIYLGGIDLSFSDREVYCRRTAYERQALEGQSRFESLERALYAMKQERTERRVFGRATQDNMFNYYRWMKDEIGRTKQPVTLLRNAGLLAEFLPSDGAVKIGAEHYPPGFDTRTPAVRLPPNDHVTRDTLKGALGDLRRLLDHFLAPDHFSHPDRLETALAESGMTDILELVVEPAVAVCRYEREKGAAGLPLLEELRERLSGLLIWM